MLTNIYIRGGSWYYYPETALERVNHRNYTPDGNGSYLGFRIIKYK
jgi:formylglycine-generating enzyme required for sulfatase activity